MAFKLQEINGKLWLVEIQENKAVSQTSVETITGGLGNLNLSQEPKRRLLIPAGKDNRIIVYQLITSLVYESRRHDWHSDACCYRRIAIEILYPDAKGWRQLDYIEYIKSKEEKYKTYFGEYLSDDSDTNNQESRRFSQPKKTIKEVIEKAERNLFRLRAENYENYSGGFDLEKRKFKTTFFHPQKRQVINRPPMNKKKIEQELALLSELDDLIKKPDLDGKDKARLKALKTITAKFKNKYFVAQYRGINYFTTRWNQPSRRNHRTQNEVGQPQYSESVMKMTPGIDFYSNYAEFISSRLRGNLTITLHNNARTLKSKLLSLRDDAPAITEKKEKKKINRYAFTSPAALMQDSYSKGIKEFLEEIKRWREEDEFWQEKLPNHFNPYVSMSTLPYHALRYAYGLKAYYLNDILEQRWRSDGQAERPHAGKVYISLHPIEDYFRRDAPFHLGRLNAEGDAHLNTVIAPERETSFQSYIAKERVFAQHVAKFPSFTRDYQDYYAEKYGLDRELYRLFQQLFINSSPHSHKRIYAEVLLAEWLCAYHEIQLLAKAQAEALKRDGILIFRTAQGFSLDEASVLPSSSDKEGWEEINAVRSERKIAADALVEPSHYSDKISIITPKAIRAKIKSPNTPDSQKAALRSLQRSSEKKIWSSGSGRSLYFNTPASTGKLEPENLLSHLFCEQTYVDYMYNYLLSIQFDEIETSQNTFGLESFDPDYFIGDCLFAAVAAIEPHYTIETLRQFAVDNIEGDIDLQNYVETMIASDEGLFVRHIESEIQIHNYEQYVAQMRIPQTWGTGIELLALARGLNRPIVLLTQGNHFDQIFEEPLYQGNEPIFLNYVNNNHYQPLSVPSHENSVLILNKVRAALSAKSNANSTTPMKK